ncbi:hypothetical protein N657DRAFT_648501 [Parathielavia appendiculata]|uniref:Uncharacterized protein n=1 Tax=Parathielavia appendiculata TaxID=2587402 RepID=A0AAN6TUX4_9PEZI|nr:hypothetical protein N657DRAFT_648501 [Parathielavia appendiculata]
MQKQGVLHETAGDPLMCPICPFPGLTACKTQQRHRSPRQTQDDTIGGTSSR